jgi:hypothetical protein
MAIESHINTFDKGMTKDYNILYQPDGTYRHCVNCSLVSQDGNNYVIKDCLGNVRTFVINTRYAGTYLTFDTVPTPIGFISFPDILIVFSTNNSTEVGGYGEIGIIKYLPYGEGVQPLNVTGNNNAGYVPLYHHSSLKFTILQQIEGFAFQENEIIKRVYWTDDLNEPRVIDIGNPVYTTYLASGSLITGETYMVLEGVITHNGVQYGPTNASGTIVNNVFTAVNANYTSVTGTAPTPKVIKYMPYQLLSFTPSRSLGNIKFTGYGSGSLYCGAKMYFYRLLNASEGIQTSWSYGSFPVPVRLGGANAYFTQLGAGTTTTLVNSDKSVLLSIDNIDQNFERIQIAVAEFDQLLDVPRIIAIVLDEEITASAMEFEHSSTNNLGTITLGDLTLFPASILTCKTMTTNKNYMLIANIKEREEFVFDKSGVTIQQINYAIPAQRNEPANSVDAEVCPNVQTYVPMDYNPFANPSGANAIQPYTRWVVTNVAGGNVTYNAVSYGLGDYFMGVPGVFTVTIPAGSQIRPCVTRNKYTTTGGTPKPDILVLSSGYWDYKDPSVATHVKGLWNEEKYRYAVVVYDLKGNPYYARHLADLNTTRQTSKDICFTESDNVGPWLYINQTGAKISGITFSPSIVANMSGFSIMRAERDARVLTQGLLIQSSLSGETVAGFVVAEPSSSYQISLDNTADGYSNIFSYICPDALVQYPIPNYVDGITSVSTSLEEAFWLQPNDQRSGGGTARYLKSVSGLVNEAETKYFSVAPAESPVQPLRIAKIRSQFKCNENTDLASFGNTSVYFKNKTATGPATVVIDTYCNTGVPASASALPGVSVAAGGLRTVIETVDDTPITYYNAVTGYSNISSGINKIVMNYVVENANQYGGNSDSALAATTYISTGHFQPINNSVLADTLDVNGNYTFNDVEIWGGDCYTCLIDYGYACFDDTATYMGVAAAGSYSWGIKFPCQCNSNYNLRTGVPTRKVAPDLMHSNAAGNGIFYRIAGATHLEGFQYNQGYSSDGHFVAYPALPVDYSLTSIFRYRIRFAGEKFPGELINTFRTFLINDYKDTDGQGGEINNLRTKDGRTIVWQNAIISSVPILERQVISTDDGSPTSIGTGGVVDRFDPINSYFGNQHQWGLTATEYGFVWFDMRRKAVVVMDFGSGITEISMVEGLKGFFDEVFLEVIGSTSTINNDLLNDPTFSKYSDRPLSGVGICGVYDPKFKMTYLTFKFKQRNATSFLNKDFTIGYYHPKKQFIGFFDWTPGILWNHNQIVLSANNPKDKSIYYGPGMPSTVFGVGEVVPLGQSEYICISPVTIASYPGVGTTIPSAEVFWTKINSTNELWVHNQPKLLNQAIAPDYLYSSFFGQVVNQEFWYVVNPQVQNAFSVLRMEQEGNGVNFTDLTISGDRNSAADTSILSTNRFYKVIYDKICSTMPLSTTDGRVTDSYLLVKWVKRNWTTNPMVVSVGVKILRFVKSFFEQKR